MSLPNPSPLQQREEQMRKWGEGQELGWAGERERGEGLGGAGLLAWLGDAAPQERL